MISMVLSASAIMYASGSTEDNSDASDSEFSENRFVSDSRSTKDNSDASDSSLARMGSVWDGWILQG